MADSKVITNKAALPVLVKLTGKQETVKVMGLRAMEAKLVMGRATKAVKVECSVLDKAMVAISKAGSRADC